MKYHYQATILVLDSGNFNFCGAIMEVLNKDGREYVDLKLLQPTLTHYLLISRKVISKTIEIEAKIDGSKL